MTNEYDDYKYEKALYENWLLKRERRADTRKKLIQTAILLVCFLLIALMASPNNVQDANITITTGAF